MDEWPDFSLSATSGYSRNRPIADIRQLLEVTDGRLDIPYASRHDAGMNTVFLQIR